MNEDQDANFEPVYQFDRNHCVYAKDANGKSFGGPIYREHYRKFTVIGENKRFWLVKEFPHKIAKFEARTAAQVDEHCWVRANAHLIAEKINDCADANLLRAVAALVGFEETK